MAEHKVYHIRDHGDNDLSRGYIGVTKDMYFRKYAHVKSGTLKAGREMVEILSGSEQACLALEKTLRPVPGIGWNTMEGGWNKIQPGCHLSLETQIKPRQRLSQATEFKPGQAAHNLGTGLHYIVTSPTGEEHYVESLDLFGRAHNLTPQNLRKVAKGQRRSHKGWTARRVAR